MAGDRKGHTREAREARGRAHIRRHPPFLFLLTSSRYALQKVQDLRHLGHKPDTYAYIAS